MYRCKGYKGRIGRCVVATPDGTLAKRMVVPPTVASGEGIQMQVSANYLS